MTGWLETLTRCNHHAEGGTTYGVTFVGLGVLLSAAKLGAAVLLATTPLTCSDN